MILLDLRSSSGFPRSSDENLRTLSNSSWLSSAAAGPLSPLPLPLPFLKEWGGVDVAVVASEPLEEDSRRTMSVFGFGVRGGGGVLVSKVREEGELVESTLICLDKVKQG